MKKTFEEYIEVTDLPQFDPIDVDHIRDAWNHQQQKIDDIIEFVKEHDMYESLQEWWSAK